MAILMQMQLKNVDFVMHYNNAVHLTFNNGPTPGVVWCVSGVCLVCVRGMCVSVCVMYFCEYYVIFEYYYCIIILYRWFLTISFTV